MGNTYRWIVSLAGLTACSDGFVTSSPAPREDGAVARASVPISGGTLAIGWVEGREVAVASDPERGKIWIVDIQSAQKTGEIATGADDEPGRVAIGKSGVAYVSLRRGGALLSVDLRSASVLERRAVCGAPRGVDVDPATGDVFVACQTGELVRLPPQGEQGRQVVLRQPDLRDVVVSDSQLQLSTFRSAILGQGAKDTTDWAKMALISKFSNDGSVPAVAWRLRRTPGEGMAFVHQLVNPSNVSTSTGGYGTSACASGPERAAVMVIGAKGNVLLDQVVANVVLPVDVAMSPGKQEVAIVAAGARPDQGSVIHLRMVQTPASSPCLEERSHPGYMVAVGYTAQGQLVVQGREPAALYLGEQRVDLAPGSVHQSGHDLFHLDVGTGVACASCHPEGGDDGVVWRFHDSKLGILPRRSMPLGGGVLRAAPFHWSADLPTLDALMSEVMVKRMGAAEPPMTDRLGLALWLDRLPAPPAVPAEDEALVVSGRAIFERSDVGCAGCHSGEALSDFSIADVGTGGRFKTPSLRGLRHRAPYLHDGCAPSLADRFSSRLVPDPAGSGTARVCGGGEQHGHTAHLAPQELSALIAYLESL